VSSKGKTCVPCGGSGESLHSKIHRRTQMIDAIIAAEDDDISREEATELCDAMLRDMLPPEIVQPGNRECSYCNQTKGLYQDRCPWCGFTGFQE